jgi:hypothetical protein
MQNILILTVLHKYIYESRTQKNEKGISTKTGVRMDHKSNYWTNSIITEKIAVKDEDLVTI